MATVDSLVHQRPAAQLLERLHNPQGEAFGEAEDPSSSLDSFAVFCTNIRSIKANEAELTARINIHKPEIIAMGETWMDETVSYIPIPGYEVVSRRDRSKDSNCGGVIVYAKTTFNCIVLLEHSKIAELSWHIIHSHLGAILFGLWYRSPSDVDLSKIEAFQTEYIQHSAGTIGSIIAGDLNIHHKNWLTFSRANTPEGTSMMRFCHLNNLSQRVKVPTRTSRQGNKYLLDLVITDLSEYTKIKVLPEITDHKIVLCSVHIPVPVPTIIPRFCWAFKKAKWNALNTAFKHTDWDTVLNNQNSDASTLRLTQYILSVSKQHIPFGILELSKGAHAWLNKKCEDAIAIKIAAVDKPNFKELAENAAIHWQKPSTNTKT